MIVCIDKYPDISNKIKIKMMNIIKLARDAQIVRIFCGPLPEDAKAGELAAFCERMGMCIGAVEEWLAQE